MERRIDPNNPYVPFVGSGKPQDEFESLINKITYKEPSGLEWNYSNNHVLVKVPGYSLSEIECEWLPETSEIKIACITNNRNPFASLLAASRFLKVKVQSEPVQCTLENGILAIKLKECKNASPVKIQITQNG